MSDIMDTIHELQMRIALLEHLLLMVSVDYEPGDNVTPKEARVLGDELAYLGQHRCTREGCNDTPICRRANS